MNGTNYCGFGDWGPCAEPFSLASTGGGTDLALWLIGAGLAAMLVGLVMTIRKRRR